MMNTKPQDVFNFKSVNKNVLCLTEGKVKHSYPLKEITQEELLELRSGKLPGFIWKQDNSLFYTQLPMSIKFPSSINHLKHLCPICETIFKSITNCPKVMDVSISEEAKRSKIKNSTFLASKRIEKYDFITLGFECFNTKYNTIIVLKCSKHKEFDTPENTNP